MTTTQSTQTKTPKAGQAQHKVASINIVDQTQILQMALNESASASVSVTRGTPRETWAIQNCNTRGESKGSKCAAKKQKARASAAEVTSINHDGPPLTMNI